MPGQAEADICITNELLLALQPQATPEAPGEQPPAPAPAPAPAPPPPITVPQLHAEGAPGLCEAADGFHGANWRRWVETNATRARAPLQWYLNIAF